LVHPRRATDFGRHQHYAFDLHGHRVEALGEATAQREESPVGLK
jgi:hypothetical protein